MTDVYILSTARTAIGSFGGALSSLPLLDIAIQVAKVALEQAGMEGGQIGHVVVGHVINTKPRDTYLARVIAMQAGIPETTPAMKVHRLCGSGAQAIVSAVQPLTPGDADIALAFGAERMTPAPHILRAARAIAEGRFEAQIVPVEVWGAKGLRPSPVTSTTRPPQPKLGPR